MPRGCVKYTAGCWFQTFFIFHHIWDVILPIDFHIFRRGRFTTNQTDNSSSKCWCTTSSGLVASQYVAPGRCPWGGGWWCRGCLLNTHHFWSTLHKIQTILLQEIHFWTFHYFTINPQSPKVPLKDLIFHYSINSYSISPKNTTWYSMIFIFQYIPNTFHLCNLWQLWQRQLRRWGALRWPASHRPGRCSRRTWTSPCRWGPCGRRRRRAGSGKR